MRAEQTAEAAINASSEILKGATRGPYTVDEVFWYGDVDIDTRHLVVWVLLSGASDDKLPKWYFPVDGQLAAIQDHLDIALRGWLDEMRETLRHEFTKVDWPHADSVRVGFDSSHRAQAEGGWTYFK